MRLIEVHIAAPAEERLDSALEGLPVTHVSKVFVPTDRLVVSFLVRANDSGSVLDVLERLFSGDESFRAVLLKVEATIPRLEQEGEDTAEPETQRDDSPKLRFGVSREELYAKVVGGSEISLTYTMAVVLSTIVAAIGLWRNDLAVIIGAMVIAPLLGPNVALALATTLADQELTQKALRANIIGVGLALGVSLAVGLLFVIDPSVDAIASRTRVGAPDVVLALAAGCAGALAYTSSVPAALIGVMVAVALLPPLVVFGLLIASGHLAPAAGAGLLLLVNVISVNLSGVVTFLWQGVQPRTWWETARAKDHTRKAIVVWSILLVVLIIVMSVAVGE